MPNFAYFDVKWPAEYHSEHLPTWLTPAQRRRCDRARSVRVSTDRTVVQIETARGKWTTICASE